MDKGISWLVFTGESKAYGFKGSAGQSVQGRARLLGKGISWQVIRGEGKA